MTKLLWLRLLAAFSLGILSGYLVIHRIAITPALFQLDAKTYVTVEQANNHVLTPLIIFLATLSLTSSVLLAYFYRSNRTLFFWYLAATAFILLAIAASQSINTPINNQIMQANPLQPPANWRSLLEHWQFGHTLRTIGFTLAFMCHLMAMQWQHKKPHHDPD